MPKVRNSKGRRLLRHARVRRKVSGAPDRPRMAVFRSLNQVYVQIIDDTKGATVAAASSLEGEVKEQKNGKSKTEVSALVGALIAQRAKKKKISSVTFDRGGYKFHGRVKALA